LQTVPGFEHAVRLSRLVDTVLTSSSSGSRLSAQDWQRWETARLDFMMRQH